MQHIRIRKSITVFYTTYVLQNYYWRACYFCQQGRAEL